MSSPNDQTISANNAFPAFFEPMLAEQYGPALAQCILDGCRAQRITSLRANALKATREEVAMALDEAGIAWSGVPWYADAFAISPADEAALRALPLYDQGGVYLQSLSSMLPPLVLGAAPGMDILDMCAAPGGKTTQLAALGGPGTRITACELHAPRAEKLEHNLRKQGAANVTVMRTDARQLSEFFRFDRILLDAPCSGSGTLRAGSPKLHERFTQKLIQKSCKSQKALLDKALELLKPGGTLVYSTCSVLACENEEAVKAALKKAAKRGTYRVEPVHLAGSQLVPADQLAASAHPMEGDAAGVEASSAMPAAPPTLPVLPALPTLPTSLEGAPCVCPTSFYEGFFLAKIKRYA